MFKSPYFLGLNDNAKIGSIQLIFGLRIFPSVFERMMQHWMNEWSAQDEQISESTKIPIEML